MSRVSLFEKAPLLFPCISIGLSAIFYLPYQFLSFSVLFSVLSALLLLHVVFKKLYILWLGFFIFGMLWLSHEYEVIQTHNSFHGLDNKLVHLKGVIKEVPFFDAKKSFQENHRLSFVVSLERDKFWQKSFDVKVNLFDYPTTDYCPGDVVEIKGQFRLPNGLTVPNGFDSQRYYQENHRVGLISVKDVEQLVVSEGSYSLAKYVYSVRKYIYEKLERNLSKEACAFYASLLIGYRNDLDIDLKNNFQQWGISHIFAISGLHMGLIAFWAWSLSGFVFISLRKRTIVTLLIALFYCVVSGAGFSAIRAFIMLGCFLGGYLLHRKINVWNSFSLAFILIFLWKPFSVFNPGFQMSFVAVGAILRTHQIFRGLFDLKGVEALADSFYQTKKRQVLNLLLYSFMISSATLVLVAYHFNTVSTVGVLLNIVIIPIFTMVLGMSFFFMILLPVLPSVLYLVSEWGYQAFESIPFVLTWNSRTHFFCESPSVFFVFITLFIYFVIPFFVRSMKRRVVSYVSFQVLVAGYLFFWGYAKSDRLTLLDTGKASAAVLQGQDGFCAIIDCGTVSGYDVVGPYLKSIGCNQIDGVFISHDNFDHFSNLPDLLQLFPVKKVYLNKPNTEPSQLYLDIKGRVEGRNASFQKGDTYFLMDHSLKGLHPDTSFYRDKNEESQIILYESKKFQVLFTGDAQKEGLEALINGEVPVRIAGVQRVLVMPHHGRNVHGLEDLLGWYNPDFILTSGDRYSEDVSEVLTRLKLEHYITSQYGTLEVRIDGLYGFKNRKWQLLKPFK